MGDKIGTLNDVISELETQTEDIKSFTKVLKEIDKVSKNAVDLDAKVRENMQSYISAAETMKKSAKLLDGRLDALETMISKGIHELYKDNQNYQKELDDSIRIRLEKFKIDIELSMKTQISDIENKIIEAINTKSRSVDQSLSDIDKKLSSVLEEYEKDRNRGFFGRLFNT